MHINEGEKKLVSICLSFENQNFENNNYETLNFEIS